LWLRLVYLGYSNFQGDEIKAMFRPLPGQNLWQFLMVQRKGPIQFLITYFIKYFDPTYLNHFLLRLPFAIAGILAVYFFFKLVKLHFGKKIALYSSLLFSLNGLLVAFSRIVQYQSFSIMFMLAALYLFSLSIKKEAWKYKGWYVGMLFWGFSMLAHYDGLFALPFVAFVAYKWFKRNDDSTKQKLFNLVGASLLGALPVIGFYVPLLLSASDATLTYWLDRTSGGTGKVSSSVVTFKLYNPKYIFYIYSSLVVLSVFKLKKSWPVLLWMLLPLTLLEGIVNVPGTHIYTYVIPGFILAAFGIKVVAKFVRKIFGKKWARYISAFGLIIFFVFHSLLTHFAFVDHKTEYPWGDKQFFVWTLKKPNPIFHLSVFGFPYYRNWEGIGDFIMSDNNGYFSTNERKSIPRFYVPLSKDTVEAGHYVSIKHPQSFAQPFLQTKAKYWAQDNDPVWVYKKDSEIMSEIYLMPKGDVDTIKNMGY